MVAGERFNSVSHLLGAVMAVAAAATLITGASVQGDPWRIVGFSIYGAMLVALYVASTLYHGLQGRA
ncbi:MAG: hemolysin III family protein, partial [Gammaproteobacteria bacterium]